MIKFNFRIILIKITNKEQLIETETEINKY